MPDELPALGRKEGRLVGAAQPVDEVAEEAEQHDLAGGDDAPTGTPSAISHFLAPCE